MYSPAIRIDELNLLLMIYQSPVFSQNITADFDGNYSTEITNLLNNNQACDRGLYVVIAPIMSRHHELLKM